MEIELIASLEEVMEVPSGSLSPNDALATLGAWDSVAVVRFLAMADATYDRAVVPAKLRACTKVSDLLSLLQSPEEPQTKR